jgi:monolysocardiolipin acyltransferase
MNDRGLLSFSNHVSLFDDPLLLSNLGSSDVKKVRWIAADHKNFFGSNLKGLIYSSGRCVPIIRGGGLNQPGFDFLIERLRNGEWVHIFPEGGRTRDKEYRLQRDFKVGIGKLIYEANPVLMPFYHYGMHHVLPIASAIPKRGKRIQVYFGHATTVDEQWWLKRLGVPISEVEPYTAWKVAAEWTENILLELEQCVHPHGKNKSAS